jgi:hypothetical protein
MTPCCLEGDAIVSEDHTASSIPVGPELTSVVVIEAVYSSVTFRTVTWPHNSEGRNWNLLRCECFKL